MAGIGFDGRARTVLQADSIQGGVHFHAPDIERPSPRQVPPPSRWYTNNERQLGEITDAVRCADQAGGDQPPTVVVVRGTPGGGKSETVYQWLYDHREDYPDGQFYVSLAAGTAESGLESEALRQFLIWVGYSAETIPATLDGRAGWFRSWSTGKRVAVAVDDAINAAQVRLLLPGSGRSVVLVTEAGSLGALRARESAHYVELDPMSHESARLLLERIVGRPRLEAELEQVDELVELCGGSTIALCVSGSLLAEHPRRPVAWLVRELSRQGRRLAVLSRDEHLSVEAVLSTALDRMDEFALGVYQAFGQHAGEHDVGVAALASALDTDEGDVREALDRLLATRLIRETGEDRYFADTLVREHASGSCDRSRARGLRRKFDEFYLYKAVSAGNALMPQRGWIERLWPDLALGSGDRKQARDWLETERANLRAVASREFAEGSDAVCRLAVALWPLHEQSKHIDDMDAVNEQAAEVAAARGEHFAEGLALVQRGFAFRHRGEYDKAAEVFARAENVAREHGPYDLAATALESRGLACREQGLIVEARDLLTRNLDMAVDIGESRRLALARMHLASVQPPTAALPQLDDAVHGFRALEEPDERNAQKSLLWTGRKLTEAGDTGAAAHVLALVLEYMVANDYRFDVAQAHHALGHCAAVMGDAGQARRHFTEAITIYRTRGYLEQAEHVLGDLDGLDDTASGQS